VSDRPRLLCIDDEELGLNVRKALLERAGYEVLTAPDGASGIDVFTAHRIDGVVVDYMLPDADGGQIAARMRSLRPEVPILLLSAYLTLPDHVLQLVDLNVLKGAGAEEFLSRVAELLAGKKCGDDLTT
jgi:CheY-like chemotaxis protein